MDPGAAAVLIVASVLVGVAAAFVGAVVWMNRELLEAYNVRVC